MTPDTPLMTDEELRVQLDAMDRRMPDISWPTAIMGHQLWQSLIASARRGIGETASVSAEELREREEDKRVAELFPSDGRWGACPCMCGCLHGNGLPWPSIQLSWDQVATVRESGCQNGDKEQKVFTAFAHMMNRFAVIIEQLSAAERGSARLRTELNAAMIARSNADHARGEAEGKLLASEMYGVVEGWKTRAEKAEAEAARLRRGARRSCSGGGEGEVA